MEDVKIGRLGWAGHIVRMEEERIPKKIAASSMLHEAKIAYYALDAAILFATSIGPAVAKAT